MTCPRRTGVAAGALLLALLAAGALAPRPAPAQALSGFDLYRSNCGGCHELYDPESPKRTRVQWDQILKRMVAEKGATLNGQEQTAVLNYLDSFNRVPREIRWIEAPAKPRKVTFLPTDAGKLPAEWVDLTIGGDTQVPWAVQADPGAKTAYLSPLKTAAENHFPLLIDNSGIVEGGGASTRVQILSGKGAVGAGIVFGFRNPQSYYGARISPRDVVLYEVQAGERALLGRAPIALPLKQWHALAVDVAGREVRVTLNGKPLPTLTRTLPTYRGGRVGLHTQGDTVALFDQWAVTVK